MAGVLQVADLGAAIKLKVRLPQARTHTFASIKTLVSLHTKGQQIDVNQLYWA